MNDLQWFLFVILVLLSGLFSGIETAFSCANHIRLKNLTNDGNKKAELVLDILEKFDKFITTILIANNIVNITLATLATVMFTKMFKVNAATYSTIFTTIIVLIFGEITPKTLAKQAPESFSMFTVTFVRFLEIILTPLVIIFNGWQWLVGKVIHIEKDDSDITDELMTMVEEAENEGDLEEHESNLITAAIEFNDLDVKDILTPRVNVIAVSINSSLKQIEETFRINTFSRLPVYENTIDNIVGVIHEKDFYTLYNDNSANKKSLKSILKPTLYTSPHTKISTLLKQLQASKTHLAVVLDEFGGTSGIITMEDIIEELVGEIWDEHDVVKEYYQQIDDKTYIVKGSCEASDLFERFDLHEDEEDDHDFVTVSGWVSHELEDFPEVGQSFEYQKVKVTVIKMNDRKVEEIKVEILDQEETETEE